MRANITLADHATIHPDKTFSLLRGGINQVYAEEGKPAILKCTMIARIDLELGEKGGDGREITLRWIDADGTSIGADLTSHFPVSKEANSITLFIEMQIALPKPGAYVFCIIVDKHQVGSYTVRHTVKDSQAKKGESDEGESEE